MARQKTVFGNKWEVAHAWAQQDQYEGREAGPMHRIYFEGPTIFSYGRHFPIASFLKRKGKESVVLFTLDRRGPTTGQHKIAARSAVSGKRIIYCLDPMRAADGHHSQNMEYWERRAQTVALKLAKATKPENYVSQIKALRAEMEEYAAFFREGIKKYKFKYLYLESKEGGKKATAAELAAEKLRTQEIERRRAESKATAIKEFRNFERDWVESGDLTYLRVRFVEGALPSHPVIETSKHVSIAEKDGLKAYNFLKAEQEKMPLGATKQTYSGVMLCGFRLEWIEPERFRVGCHLIEFKELDAVAAACGWNQPAPEQIPVANLEG